ncbi:MAG: ABC transporter permease [Candidatus Bathyarchaeia archaeon]
MGASKSVSSLLHKYLSITEVNRSILTVCLCFIVNFLNPFFLTAENLRLILIWGSVYALSVMGEMFYLLVGAIDLSFGGVICLSNVLAAAFMKWYGLDVWLSVFLVLLIGLATGLATGLFGICFSPPFKFMIPVFIFTLMLNFVYTGVMKILTGAFSIYELPPIYSVISRQMIGPIPIVLIYTLATLAVTVFFLYYRPVGRHIYATGLSDDVALRVGVNVKKVRLLALSIGSMIQAFVGVVAGSYLGQGSILIGPAYLLPVLAGTFIGGISLAGGEGTPFGALLGGFMIYLVESIIVTLRIGAFWKEVVTGIFLLLFVIVDFIQKRGAFRR